MPVINLTFPSGTWTDDQKTQLADKLTLGLLKYEGFEPTPKRLSTVRVYLNEVAAAGCRVGGALSLEKQTAFYQVFVFVPEGTLSDEAKNGLVGEFTQALLEMEGTAMTL